MPPVLLLGLAVIAVAYAFTCLADPFTDCGRCGGRGYPTTKRGIRSGYKCSRCKGTGKRLRTGRRLMNQIVRAKEGIR